MEKSPCRDCGGITKKMTRGLCSVHYARRRYEGTLEEVALPPAPNGRARPGDRYVTPQGYVILKFPGLSIPEHRFVMQMDIRRRLVPGESVHHLNGVRDDNRRENLELWYKPQPAGQRVVDLIRYIAEFHSEAMREALDASA